MPLFDDDDEHDLPWLGAVLRDLQSEDLTEWEQGFVDDMTERYEKYGAKTFISEKQEEVLNKMREKYL